MTSPIMGCCGRMFCWDTCFRVLGWNTSSAVMRYLSFCSAVIWSTYGCGETTSKTRQDEGRRLPAACFIWRQAAFAAVLYAAANCLFHAHHQLMFVNYLPFLVLALIGIDRFIEKRKGILLCVGLTLVYFHSFYYAPSCLCVAGIYYLYRVRQAGTWPAAAGKKAPKGAGQRGALAEESPKRATTEAASRHGDLKTHGSFLLWILLSIGLAAVLLLPTGLDILSTSKDAGSFAGSKMPLVNPKLDGLLYSPYGMGLTLIGLYALLCALGKRRMRLWLFWQRASFQSFRLC